VVKTKVASTLVNDLDQTLKALNKFQWKLNLKKCIFGMSSSILLNNIVSHDGIRPNPEKIKAVMKMKPPKCIKDIQKLTRCMATLSRFISFTELKQFLTSSLVLTAPKEGKTLLLYIVATNRVVSTTIVVECEEVGHVYKI
jgi:hypothetical protein